MKIYDAIVYSLLTNRTFKGSTLIGTNGFAAIVSRVLRQGITMLGPRQPPILPNTSSSVSLLNWVKLKYSSQSQCQQMTCFSPVYPRFGTVFVGRYGEMAENRNESNQVSLQAFFGLHAMIHSLTYPSSFPKIYGTCGRKLVGKLVNAMHHPLWLRHQCRRLPFLEDRAREWKLTTIDLFHSTSR